MENQLFKFGDQEIAFQFAHEQLMVSATTMAKVFGKNVANFMMNQQVDELLNEAIKDENFYELLGVQDWNSNLELSELTMDQRKECFIKVVHGGRNNGTWMHEIFAIKFAAWLSPAFELWMLKTIRRIMLGPYHDLDVSIKEEVEINSKIELLEKKLQDSEEYKAIENLRQLKRQLKYRRNKQIAGQFDLFSNLSKQA